ncbi:MAG: hypothetical protein WD894_21660 [Pirellulales bacterium]
MNDETLQELLKQADERFQAAAPREPAANVGGEAFVDGVRRRRTHQARRRTSLGVLAVILVTAGVSAWSLNADIWRGPDQLPDLIASKEASESDGIREATVITEPPQGRRLRDDEIARLKTEIAALDAEANQARRFVELYQAAEARRERLAAVETHAEPLLSPQVLADLEIDRAAAITVISADSQANEFNRMADAADAYRSVVKHFPDSRWASVARERLFQAQHMN